MFATRTTDDCKYCATPAAVCRARNLTGEPGRCCRRCRPWHRAHRERTERRDLPEPEPPAAVTSVAPTEVLDRDDEDRVVAAVLEAAEADAVVGGAREMFDRGPSTAAYRSLARSRGLDLDVVVRSALRGRLADVVRMPSITTDHKPAPATAGPDSPTVFCSHRSCIGTGRTRRNRSPGGSEPRSALSTTIRHRLRLHLW